MTLSDIGIASALSLAGVASAGLTVAIIGPPTVAVLGFVGTMVPVCGIVSICNGRN